MKKYLKDLPLSLPTGSLIEPFCFNSKTVTALQKWLNWDQIEALRCRAEFEMQTSRDNKDAPMLADERIVLQRAGELASALAMILEQAPARASAELDLLFQKHLGGWQEKELTGARLNVLAHSLDSRLNDMPKQDRRKSPVFFVSQIAEVLNAADIKNSLSENSRFFKICAILFEAIGIYQSPAAPIKAFMNN
jgi:hypothetical protein